MCSPQPSSHPVRRLAVLLSLAATFTAVDAQAADLRGTNTALVLGREIPRRGDELRQFAIYERLAFDADALGLPGFDQSRVVAHAWARFLAGDEDSLAGDSLDLELLYIEGRTGALVLRLGRQHVLEGLGRVALIDGLDAKVYLPADLSVQGFFGATAPRELDYESGGWEGGGRLAYHLPMPGEVGFSYHHRRRDGELYAEAVGLDGYAQLERVLVNLRAAYAPREERLVEGRLAVGVTVLDELRVTVDAERVYPDLLLPRDSLFSVFADAAHDALGGDLAWSPSRYYALVAEGHALWQDASTRGYRAALRATAYREPNHRSFVGAEVRRLDESENAYVRGRVFTSLQVLPPLRAAADAYAYAYDERLNGVRNSYLGSLSLVWDLTPGTQLAGSLGMGKTPSADFQLEGQLRLTFGYGVALAEEQWP